MKKYDLREVLKRLDGKKPHSKQIIRKTRSKSPKDNKLIDGKITYNLICEILKSEIKAAVIRRREVKKILKNFHSKFLQKYKTSKDEYDTVLLHYFMFNKNCHIVCLFKDYMIYDYIEEFFKRYYMKYEFTERMPKIAKYYSTYHVFYCKPIFRDFMINKIVHKYNENKAEAYYKQYRKKKEGSRNNLTNLKTIFNTTVRDNINNSYSLNLMYTKSAIKNELLTHRSKQTSIRNLLNTMEDELHISQKYLQTEEFTSKPNKAESPNKRKLIIGRTMSNVDKSSKKKNINFKKILGSDVRFMHKKINSMLTHKSNSKTKVDTEKSDNVKITFSLKMDKFAKKESQKIVNNVNININNHYILNTDENEQITRHKSNILRYQSNKLNRFNTPIDNQKKSVLGYESGKPPLYRTANSNIIKNKSYFTNCNINRYSKVKTVITNRQARKMTHHSEAHSLVNNSRVNTCPSQEKHKSLTKIDKVKLVGKSQIDLKKVFNSKLFKK
jgi:hypothetical protein